MEVVILPKKPKVQSSLRDFFAKNSSYASSSVATGSSSSNESSASRSVATGLSSSNAMQGSTDSTSWTSARPESLVGIASTTDNSSVVSRSGSSTRSGTQSSNGRKTCKGIILSSCNFGNYLVLMKRYGKTNPGGVHEMNEFSYTGTYNLYAKTCKGEVIPRARKTCMVVCWDNCRAEWTNKSLGYKDFVQRRRRNFTSAMRLLNLLAFSYEDETTMNKLLFAPGMLMNEGSGRNLITMVKHRLEFYREAKVIFVVNVILHPGRPQTMLIQLFNDNFISLQKIPVCWQERVSANATSTFVTNGNEFLNTVNKNYKINPKFQGSLLVALMHVFMSIINGEKDLAFPVKSMNFFIVSESMYRRTFDLVLVNLMRPILRMFQSINAKSRGTAIIQCDTNSIKERAKKIITMKN